MKPVQRSASSVALTIFLALLQPTLFMNIGLIKEQPLRAAYRKYPYRPPGLPVPSPSLPAARPQLESRFITALAQACVCRQHSRSGPSRHLIYRLGNGHHNRRRACNIMAAQTRAVHHAARQNLRPASSRTLPSRDEYLNLVETYRELYTQAIAWEPAIPPMSIPYQIYSNTTMPVPHSSDQRANQFDASVYHMEVNREPVYKADAQTSTPVRREEYERQSNDLKQTTGADQILLTVKNLISVLKSAHCAHEEAFQAYSALPSPGVSYLTEPEIRILFRRLATAEKKHKGTASQYLSVVNDMKESKIAMNEAEWNSAIAFCGQSFSYVRGEDVEKALLIWREMENEAHVRSSNVTFNILFDMAAKAGKYTLADMILQEMETRGYKPNRYSRVGNIYFQGLKGDGQGIRNAYRDLVHAGEVVDTVVLNCVIASLIKAGEYASAEHVYGRMKQMLSRHGGRKAPRRTWQETRDLGRFLDKLALARQRNVKNLGAEFVLLQRKVSIMPDVHTYSLFVEYHADQTGDLHSIAALLSEMQTFGVSVHGRIFLKLFKGFTKHGGKSYTSWTSPILKRVWDSLLAGLDSGYDDVKITKWVIIWAVRAFDRCAGRVWALHIWEELRSRWKPTPKELQSLYGRLGHILARRDQDPM